MARPYLTLRLMVVLALVLPLAAGCAPVPRQSAPVKLTVFAAASLGDAFSELGRQYEASHPGVRVEFNFAGSQQLAQQLAQGAAADVFASANTRQMDAAVAVNRVAGGTPRAFAGNRLVVVYPADGEALSTLADLARPGLRLVLAAPEVPVGQYALEFLNRAAATAELGSGFRSAVLSNVVSYEENVKAVRAKVSLGEADAGIVYTSDIAGPGAANVGRLDIPDALNVIAEYPIAPVADATHPAEARAFIDWVLSPAGQAILAEYGFLPPARR